jgi:hypothetical protein
MKRSKGDIRVIGRVGGTHVIEDIQRDVPFRTLVIIPEEQALMSKDLWRAISQGCLEQLTSAPYPAGATVPAPDESEKVRRLEQYCADLESQLVRAKSENDALKRKLEAGANSHSAKLDEILMAIQAGIKVVPAAPAVHPAPQLTATELRPVSLDDVVDGSAPTFLPGVIVPKDVDTRINIQGEAATSEAFTDASDRLRRLRKKSTGG